MRQLKAALLIASFALSGCVTETRKASGEVIEPKPKSCAPGPVQQVEIQVRQRIDHMRYESGTQLLRSIETIASCKELALRPISESLQSSADVGVRANLVYTLGLIGGSQAHALVTQQISDKSPIIRYEAAAALLQFKDWSGVPLLISFLEDDDRRIRFKSFQALSTFANEDFGYDFGAPEPSRAESVTRWKEWWSTRRSELVFDESPPAR